MPPSGRFGMYRRLNFHGVRLSTRSSLRRGDEAPGVTRLGSRRRTRQRAPAKAWLATVAKPASSARSASSRCAIRSDGRQVRVRSPARTSSARAGRAPAARRPPPRATRRARRAPSPGPCARAARARRGRRGRRAARARSPRPPRPRARLRLDHLRAAVGVELGDRPRVDSRITPTAIVTGSSSDQDDRQREHRQHLDERRRRPRPARQRAAGPRPCAAASGRPRSRAVQT